MQDRLYQNTNGPADAIRAGQAPFSGQVCSIMAVTQAEKPTYSRMQRRRMLRHPLKDLSTRLRDLRSRAVAKPQVTAEAVQWGYRLFLNREPENSKVVDEKVRSCTTLQELVTIFLASDEFRQKNSSPHTVILSGEEPKMEIAQVDTAQDLQRLFEHIQTTWQHLGETEPYWSVIASERFKRAAIKETREEFYHSGRQHVVRLFNTLERNGIDHTTFRTCLEYGCGLGRVSRWLCERFESVYGYDISIVHLQGAKHYLSEQNISNITLRHIRRVEDIRQLPRVDLIYSLIVLQHNPPPLIGFIVREFLRALNPGGVALFQVPTYHLGYSFSLETYLNNDATRHEMEMHVLPQRVIFDIVQQEGGHVVEVLGDSATGLRYKGISNTFLIQKRA